MACTGEVGREENGSAEDEAGSFERSALRSEISRWTFGFMQLAVQRAIRKTSLHTFYPLQDFTGFNNCRPQNVKSPSNLPTNKTK